MGDEVEDVGDGGGDAELLADADGVAAQVVSRFDLRYGDAVFGSDRGERLAGYDLVDDHGVFAAGGRESHVFLTGVFGVDVESVGFRLVDGEEGVRGIVARLHRAALAVFVGVEVAYLVLAHKVSVNLLRREDEGVSEILRAGDHVGAKLRVEYAELVHGYVEHARDLVEVDALGNLERVHHERLHGEHGRDVVLRVILHHVIRGDKHGHVAARLGREIVVDRPEVMVFRLTACAAYGLVDGARAAVVGRDGERPVAIHGVEILEVFRGLLRGHVGVATLVDERVYLQAEPLGRAEHELPETRRAVLRDGVGVEARLHHGEVFELEREPLLFESLLEDRHIIEAETEDGGHLGAPALGVAVDVAAHHLVVGHLDHRGEGVEAAHHLLVGDVDVGLRLVAVVGGGVILYKPAFEELLRVGLEAFGVYDSLVGDALLEVEHIGLFCIFFGEAGERGGGQKEVDEGSFHVGEDKRGLKS